MVKRSFGNAKKERTSLSQEQVNAIARMALVEKIDPRAIAKDLRVKPRLVRDIIAAKSHKDFWISAIADLARERLLT